MISLAEKECARCHIVKPLEEFQRRRSARHGRFQTSRIAIARQDIDLSR